MYSKLYLLNRKGFFSSSKRNFNQPTLHNVHKYLIENKGKIDFEKNESGFIRLNFPNWVLVSDNQIEPLDKNDVLRANYWFYKSLECGMGDESIHDHPRKFQSYIVNGGYEHEVYHLINDNSEKIKINLVNFLKLEILPHFGINIPIDLTFGNKNFKFAIDKFNKNITYEGTVILKQSFVESPKKGDIVEIDTNLIHRVSKYHTVSEEKTLSLNIVRNNGKFKTNIFLPEMKTASVKIERDKVSAEEAILATDELIELFSRSKMGN